MCEVRSCVALLLLSVAISVANGRPSKADQDALLLLQDMHDTATVESIVREARAAPVPSHIGDLLKPGVKDAFLYIYGDTDGANGDVHGYSKKADGKGREGYKHFDSYHKKDGDKYGYEKHSEYGHENKDKVDLENAKSEEKQKEGDDDGEESRNSYSVFENAHGDGKKNKKSMVDDFEGYNEGAGTHKSESYQSESGGESGEGGDGEGGDEGYEYAESENYSEGSEDGGEGGEEEGESEGGYKY